GRTRMGFRGRCQNEIGQKGGAGSSDERISGTKRETPVHFSNRRGQCTMRKAQRFCSSQVLARSFAPPAKVANSTAKCSAFLSKRRVVGTFILRLFRAQKLSPCGHLLRR